MGPGGDVILLNIFPLTPFLTSTTSQSCLEEGQRGNFFSVNRLGPVIGVSDRSFRRLGPVIKRLGPAFFRVPRHLKTGPRRIFALEFSVNV